MYGEHLKENRPPSPQIGKAQRIDDATGRYIVYLKSTFPAHLSLEGLRIVVDCANGAAYRIAPQVFAELGAEVIPIGVSPQRGEHQRPVRLPLPGGRGGEGEG